MNPRNTGCCPGGQGKGFGVRDFLGFAARLLRDFSHERCGTLGTKTHYGIPPEQVVGSAADTQFGYDKDGKAILTKVPKVMLVDDKTGKPVGIHLMIGRRPMAAFGNSTGDQQMLEYTQGGGGARLMMLVHHDDDVREYAYGPTSKVGTFTDALMAEAKKRGWVVISMKNNWKRIFAWEQ